MVAEDAGYDVKKSVLAAQKLAGQDKVFAVPVSYTHLRAHETVLDLVCRLLLEKKKHKITHSLR